MTEKNVKTSRVEIEQHLLETIERCIQERPNGKPRTLISRVSANRAIFFLLQDYEEQGQEIEHLRAVLSDKKKIIREQEKIITLQELKKKQNDLDEKLHQVEELLLEAKALKETKEEI